MICQRHDFATLNQCCRSLAEHIVATARQCVAQRDLFTLVASGGSTPKSLYRLLAAPGFAEQMPWQQTHLFWGDERCVAADHPDSNFRMVKEALLAQGGPVAPTVHRMPGEMTPREGAAAYEKELRTFFGSGGHETISWPVFDLILLGLGSDGHTASLFPDSPALAEQTRWVTATSPGILDPQVDRLTLTIPTINNGTEVIFLVAGAEKKALAERILTDRQASTLYPAARITSQSKLLWYIADA